MTEQPIYCRYAGFALIVLCLTLAVSWAGEAPTEILLKNPGFEEGTGPDGVPVGWLGYLSPAGADPGVELRIVPSAPGQGKALLIRDDHPDKEIGIRQTVKVKPNTWYEVSVDVRADHGAMADGSHLLLEFGPTYKLDRAYLTTEEDKTYTRFRAIGKSPPDATRATIVLYTHRLPTPRLVLDNVKLIENAPPPLAPIKPVSKIYTQLKDLCLQTRLVTDGKPNAAIVVPATGRYTTQATRIAACLRTLTGVDLPIVTDDAPEAAVPVQQHLILLGNRSTNRTIEELYNQHYTLLDLRYPGPGGHLVRTLHNPFGNQCNVIFVGGSDDAGVAAATEVFEDQLQDIGAATGQCVVGRLAEIQLATGITVPTDVRELRIWEASKGYRDTGYFGWNSISKHMAAYYMTGDEYHAREVIRLAFPDARAKKQIAEIDGERIENKDEPLSGPYHYNAHMLVLYWDLIEESPVFSDEERLRVTNALAKQLLHHKGTRDFQVAPPVRVGSRHGQWTAISMYCLGRYFQTYYPERIWRRAREEGRLHFASLHRYLWVVGEFDYLPWFPTGAAPVFAYMTLTGDRKPIENGTARELLRGLETLTTGKNPDWALNCASIGFLHRAAYLFGDGRFIHYRNRSGVDTSVFRLGQSYWPAPELAPTPPTDLIGRWTVQRLSKPAWRARRSRFDQDATFRFASFRTTLDGGGDLVLLKGINQQLRNPYHNLALLHLRIAGHDLLDGYGTQITTRADGIVERRIPMNGALRDHDVLGGTAYAIGEVPNLAFCNWKRLIALRTGRYALVVDDLAFRIDSENLEAQISWERDPSVGQGVAANGVLELTTSDSPVTVRNGWVDVRAIDAPCTTNMDATTAMMRLRSHDTVLLRATKPGHWLALPFELDRDLEGDIFIDVLKYADRGSVRFFLDGKPIGMAKHDLRAPSAVRERIALGAHKLAAGSHRLRVEVVSINEALGKGHIPLIGLSIAVPGLRPAPTTVRAAYDLCLSDPVQTTPQGRIVRMTWRGAAKAGEHRILFTAIARNRGDPLQQAACARLAPNAAALAVPEPAIAVRGAWEGLDGELVVLGHDHLFGTGCRRVGTEQALLVASAPVRVDWDFFSGKLCLVADTATTVRIAAAPGRVDLDGKPLKRDPKQAGILVAELTSGRYEIIGINPPPESLAALRTWLAKMTDQAQRARGDRVEQDADTTSPNPPALVRLFEANAGGSVVDLITVPGQTSRQVCVATGKTVRLLTDAGKPVRDLSTDGDIRMLRWWAEHELLLAGCADEQVIAFDRAGKRKWVFTSEMDPAVFRAAKTYWFKSAPGHEGIHGLHTGVFMDGTSQAFVGSACTLEILDANGTCVKRMPQFWGKVSHFTIVDGPDKSLNLLAARKYAGGGRIRIINNRKVTPGTTGFLAVPKGHTFMRGWSNMSRRHVLYRDLDGDGVKEVIQDMNGAWNRITVYTAAGKPLYDASFGPGKRIPYRNLRDLDVADLDGDGKCEIIVGTASGLVVVLDHQCRKKWSKRLHSPPSVLKAMKRTGSGENWVVVGCDDGTVLALDSSGKCVRTNSVQGAPTCIAALDDKAHDRGVLIGTDKGRVALFQVE